MIKILIVGILIFLLLILIALDFISNQIEEIRKLITRHIEEYRRGGDDK